MQTFMMIFLLAALMSSQGVFTRIFNKKMGVSIENSALLSVTIFIVMALFFFCMCGFRPTFHPQTILYATIYALLVAINLTAASIAIGIGPFALSKLLFNCSTVVVVLFGILFLQETISFTMGAGLLLLGISLVLLRETTPEEYRLTFRWFIAVFIVIFCDAGCSISQKLHQTDYPGAFQYEFMFFGASFSALLCLIYCILKKIKPKHLKTAVCKGWILMVCYGLACSIVNVILLNLHVTTDSALLFPTLAGLNLILAALLSRFAYHEKMTKHQKWSFIIGVCSLIFMNL